ncbi:hypothetical protein V490_02080 [Pseudogymnoascus sp. VKM F-3557]|nr:hypothetical protein V490_02080 [Pseudogymnoascus sp. VKM F-3557]
MSPKRLSDEDPWEPNKRAKSNQTVEPEPKAAPIQQKRANTRSASAKNNNADGAQIKKSGPAPKRQLRHLPPLTEPNGFPCFSDGDTLIIGHPGNTRYQYRLHSYELRKLGHEFRDLLSTEADNGIPKKQLGPNNTRLKYCLELSKDPTSAWVWQKGSLYESPIQDNFEAIPATAKQTNGRGGGLGGDGSTDDTPTPPIDEGSVQSPPQASFIHSSGEDDLQGSLHDTLSKSLKASEESVPAEHLGYFSTQDRDVDMSSAAGTSEEPGPMKHFGSSPNQSPEVDTLPSPTVSEESGRVADSRYPQTEEGEVLPGFRQTINNEVVEALGEMCGSVPVDDNQTQGSIQSDTNVFTSTTPETVAATEVTAEAPLNTEASVLGNGAPLTPTHEPNVSVEETGQFNKPGRMSGDMSAAMGSHGRFSKGGSCDRITNSQIAARGNRYPSTPISDSTTYLMSPKSEDGDKKADLSKMATPINTPNTETLRRGCAEILIPILNFHSASSVVRIGDNGKKTYSVRASIGHIRVPAQDDDCQIISVKPKRQSRSDAPVIPIAKDRPEEIRNVQALHSLLRVLYHRAPIISRDDINVALIQSEDLVKKAKSSDILPAVRAHTSNLLARHGRTLFQSVALEPFRWLNLSFELQDKIIFREAIIHAVGTIPVDFTLGSSPGMHRKVIRLVQRKVEKMGRDISDVNVELLSASIYEDGKRASLEDESSRGSWIVARYWCEWVATNIREAKIPSRHPDEPNIQSKLGMLYRALFAGGKAYLRRDEWEEYLYHPLLQIAGNQIEDLLQWDKVKYDLALLKASAREKVQGLCKNRSQLDPAEGGFAYLTCTKVESHELPWDDAPSN